MKKEVFKITHQKQTHELAKQIASQLEGGEVIGLIGPLGAGKTTFTQYLAQELGVEKHVNSPTFVLMKIYETKRHPLVHLVHVDAYRIDNEEEIYDLGIDEYVRDGSSVVVVEWADKVRDFLKEQDNLILLTFEHKGDEREVTVESRL